MTAGPESATNRRRAGSLRPPTSGWISTRTLDVGSMGTPRACAPSTWGTGTEVGVVLHERGPAREAVRTPSTCDHRSVSNRLRRSRSPRHRRTRRARKLTKAAEVLEVGGEPGSRRHRETRSPASAAVPRLCPREFGGDVVEIEICLDRCRRRRRPPVRRLRRDVDGIVVDRRPRSGARLRPCRRPHRNVAHVVAEPFMRSCRSAAAGTCTNPRQIRR